MATYENWLNRKRGRYTGDRFKLDTENKTVEQNIIEIIQGLYLKKPYHDEKSPNKIQPPEQKPGLRTMSRLNSDSGRLSYLNALVTLLCKEESLGFTTDELMLCIRVSLVDESMSIRVTALRALRHLIKTERDVAIFNNLKLPYIVMRSLDLMLRNEEERAQALRVVRRIVAVVGSIGQSRRHRAAYIEPGLLRCLAAVAKAGIGGDGTADRLAKPAVATLAEICVLNPELFITCGGVNAVLRQLAECATPRMAEALCGVLLHLLNDPTSRSSARIDLTCLSAPYCDFHVRAAGTESTRDEREMRFTCSRLALLCVLRSWPGLLHFCHPYSTGGLRALVRALYLPRLEVRKAILDLLYELVGLPQPEWTDEISVALDAVDPSDFQDSWRLNEGFVAAEGIAILPHLSATGTDITEIHLALLLQCFLEAGLLDGLAEVIVSSDTFISVRATVLLGQLLHLVHLFLPPQICSLTPALPTLMSQASAGKPQALAAIAALKKLHNMLEARPASNSLFLDHIIQCCSGAFKENEDMTKSRKEKDNANIAKPKEVLNTDSAEFLQDEFDNENEPKQRHSIGSRADIQTRNIAVLVKSKSVSSRTSAAVSKVTKSAKFFNLFERDSDNLLRCSLVMQNKDGNTWNWEIIRTILKENDTSLLNLNDSGHKAWMSRIVNYLKPCSNKYSHTDLSSTCHGHSATRAGCQLIRHLLLAHNDNDSNKLLEDFFNDVSHQIEAIETGRKAHECLFSPQHMCNTMCQMYFLFIGQLCHSHTGLRIFKQTRLYENLLELSTKTHHSCYVKLVISSLDYNLDSFPRDILAKTLTCNIQASRMYTTQFLNVLLRATRKSRELVRRKSKFKKNFVRDAIKSNKDDGEGGVDMETWILQMLIGQLKDESKPVVKCALSILEEAFSVNDFLDKMIPMRDALGQNCRLSKDADPTTYDFNVIGDRGYLLWLCLEVAALSQNAEINPFIQKHLDYWTNSYNYRYVRLVEAVVHDALLLCEHTRGASRARRAARVPPHLYAALANKSASILANTAPMHHRIIQRKKCGNEQEIADLKASLWAVGNMAVTSQGLQVLMNLTNGFLEDSIPLHIVRLAKYCNVYSVRATAFYVLGLFGSTYDGANLLSDLGWLCVRHTRHEQFPIIPDETYQSIYDITGNSFITSPDRRYNIFDTETSEHSDHTDQSIIDSLQSDCIKNLKTLANIDTFPDGKDQDVVDHKLNIPERKESDKRKSHTLPNQGGSVSYERTLLSESRTVDILRDYSNVERPVPSREHRLLSSRMNSLEHAHEGRVRNTSESSTSGVSSCDSFLGKYAIPDRVLTLSPIPSSSSLYGMKGSSSTHKPRLSESLRRTSTSSFTTPDVSSSPPSQLDMTGYETLRSIYRNRRPHLSESAATSTEMDDLTWLLTDTSRRSNKPFSSLRERTKASRERRTKLSLLDYDWKPLTVADRSRESPPPSLPPRKPQPLPPSHPSAYIGISVPRDLLDLFPRDSNGKSTHGDIKESSRRRVPSFLLDSSIASMDNKSRATPDSQHFSSFRGTDLTSSTAGLRIANMAVLNAVGTNKLPIIQHSTKSEKDADKSSIDMNDIVAGVTAMTTSIETADKKNKIESIAESSDKKEANDTESIATSSKANALSVNTIKWRHITADCLACTRTRPPSVHELREAFFSGLESSECRSQPSSPVPSISQAQTQVLNQVHYMSNPIHLKQTRSALISLKQRHPDLFRSPCLYSDVCALLARDTYMLCARRFLQELFLETSFDCFASEPLSVLSRHLTSPNAVAAQQ